LFQDQILFYRLPSDFLEVFNCGYLILTKMTYLNFFDTVIQISNILKGHIFVRNQYQSQVKTNLGKVDS